MRIIDGGDKLKLELSSMQLTLLMQLLLLKINGSYPEDNANAGFVIFKGSETMKELNDFFGYDSIYIEFFFDRSKGIHGMNKVIIYDGDEPDEVLDAISKMKEECNGFKPKDTKIGK